MIPFERPRLAARASQILNTDPTAVKHARLLILALKWETRGRVYVSATRHGSLEK
jgi:hypothetical protein